MKNRTVSDRIRSDTVLFLYNYNFLKSEVFFNIFGAYSANDC